MFISQSPSHSQCDEHDDSTFHSTDSLINPDSSHLVDDLDEASRISASSNSTKVPIDFSGIPCSIGIHPMNNRLEKTSTQQFIKRPLNAYMLWTMEQRAKTRRAPNQRMNEISRQMGEVWKKMSNAAKAPYLKQAKKLAEEHKKALKENPNLIYIPLRKNARFFKPTNKDSVSNPTSPDSVVAASPASSDWELSFSPNLPTPTSQYPSLSPTPIAHLDSSSIMQLPPAQIGEVSKFSFQALSLKEPDLHPETPIPTIDDIIPPPPSPSLVQYELPQLTQQPMPYRSLASQPNNQLCPADMLLTSNQIRERYYSALCAPLVPQLFELPSTLKESNYYYDLHLLVFKRSL